MARSSNGYTEARLLYAAQHKTPVVNVPGSSVPPLFKLRTLNDALIEPLSPFCSELSLAGHKLDLLPQSLSSLTCLTVLRLDTNRLRDLANVSFQGLTQLRLFSCSHNHLAALPPTLVSCAKLETLLCAGNDIEALPKGLNGCTALRVLDCSSNQIKVIEKGVGLDKLHHLERLHFDHNGCTKVMATKLPASLTNVTLNGSPLSKGLPASFSLLRRLTTLSANHCFSKAAARRRGGKVACLSALSDLAEAGSVEGVILAGRDGGRSKHRHDNHGVSTATTTTATTTTATGAEAPPLRPPVPLTRLELRGNHLPAIPPTILLRFTAMKVLNLSQNLLGELPEELGALTLLEELRVDRNPPLRHLPASLGRLRSLRLLCAYGCAIECVPGSIVELGKAGGALREVDLRSNSLRQWPSEFGELKQLRTLRLADNRISSIPGEHILGLRRLERLDVNKNRISSLPENMPECLPMLCALSVEFNGLRHLPDCLERMVLLKEIAWDNPERAEAEAAVEAAAAAGEEEDDSEDDDDSTDGSDSDSDGSEQKNDEQKNEVGAA